MKYIIITILSLSVLMTGCKKEEPVVVDGGDSKATTTVDDIVKATTTDDRYEVWKTYRNEEYGFELKYPVDWDVYNVDTVGLWKPGKNQVINIVPGDDLVNYAPIQVIVLRKEEIELKKYEFILSLKKVNEKNDVSFFYRTDGVLSSEYYILSGHYIYQFSLIDGFINYSKGDAMMRQIVYSFDMVIN